MNKNDREGQSDGGTRFKTTGISGLDQVLHEGIPQGHVVMVAGRPGTGKTVLASQWLFAGAETGENGAYIAVTEPVTDSASNVRHMAFYEDNDAVHFTDLRSTVDLLGIEDDELDRADIEALVDAIEQLVTATSADRLVIDSITAVGYMINDPTLFRYFIFRLGNVLSERGCTTMLTSEAVDTVSPFHVEDFIADGIIRLEYTTGEQSMMRTLNVHKMRKADYRSGPVHFMIDKTGVTVYPKITANRVVADTSFTDTKSSGITALDDMLDGGYPQGHMVLVAGNTGCGKTTLGTRYLLEGLEQGDPCLFINIEEPQHQILKTVQANGMDLEPYLDDGLLQFISPPLIDTYPDRLLHEIVDTVDDMGAERVLIDSISALRSDLMGRQKLRETLLQLTSALKTRGTTCMMTYLTSKMFTASGDNIFRGLEATDIRISSVCDGILLLRYVEHENEVAKALNVLKMRGVDHSRDIRRFRIANGDIHIGDTFN